ncbi:fungal-specific transcription factor domain-containing protein [Auriculariales sp. MPI-PUGE-AT-0066]|nr:fungal-specific transcription factor domain-containing protein [Auriculariales sp. MPI-PUGE-AT-0066]
MRELGLLTISAMPSVALIPGHDGRDQQPDLRRSIAATLCPLEELYVQRVEYSLALRQQYAIDGPTCQSPSNRIPFSKRPEYWRVPNYEFRNERLPDRVFHPRLPPPDRLALLVRRFFETINVVYPILHRELFERQLFDQVLMSDAHFVAVVLLVCALGEGQLVADDMLNSSGATSPANTNPAESSGTKPAGIEYFEQVEPFLRMPTPAEPRLLDVRVFYLASFYVGLVLGSPRCWWLTYTAIQMAIQRDDHRRRQTAVPNLMDELKKRIFWSLVITDRRTASMFGHPIYIKDDAFDLELPLEVDDARWDLATVGFPLNGPLSQDSASSCFFAWQVRLSLIQGFIIQTIYSSSRTRTLMGFVGADWENRMMQRLDGLLKDWIDNIPESLSWHPNIINLDVFLRTSFLHAMYRTLVIMAHNPFMRTTARDFSRASRDGTTGVDLTAALSTCTQAAVECSDILALLVSRIPWAFGLPGLGDPPFVSGLILLINLYGFRSSLTETDRLRYTHAVSVCLSALRLVSTRFRMHGKLHDLLDDLMTELADEPASRPSSSPSVEFDSMTWQPASTEPTSSRRDDLPNNIFNIDMLPSGLRMQMVTGLGKDVPPTPLPQL